MRHDFNRIFFPVEYNNETSDEPLIVMWTGLKKGFAPVHFVPLLPKRKKYEILLHKFVFIQQLHSLQHFILLSDCIEFQLTLPRLLLCSGVMNKYKLNVKKIKL